MSKAIGVLIPAAGSGRRLGGVSKPLIEIGGETIIHRLLMTFQGLAGVRRICLAVPSQDISLYKEIVQSLPLRGIVNIVEGGSERPYSVRNAFAQLKDALSGEDLVCIHDAARPFLSEEDLEAVIAAGWNYGAAFLAARIKDTLKLIGDNGFCESTIDRTRVYAAQTPQVMKYAYLEKAYNTVIDLNGITDEIMLLEKIGTKAYVVEPKHVNPKITTPEDLELARRLSS